ncbi:MAG TPA: hypothetical protein VGL42_07185 [Opitutaceae bacterium]
MSLWFIACRKHAPGLMMRFKPAEIPGIENRALAMIDGLGLLLNTLIAVYCVTCYFVIRRCLARRQRWAFFLLAIGALLIQAACYLADGNFFLNKNTLVLHASSILLATGFILCAIEIFKREPNRSARQTPQ